MPPRKNKFELDFANGAHLESLEEKWWRLLHDGISPVEPVLSPEAYAAKFHLRDFIKQSWHVIEPATEYQHNWHIDAISEYLEAVTAGQITRLLINMPPRHMKSISVSQMWPCWEWIRFPHLRYLVASYAQSLSTEHSVARRTIIQSDWYQTNFGDAFKLSGDQNEKIEFRNDKRGVMFATSLHGTGTGKGGNRVIIDDPHNVKQAMSDVQRESDLYQFDKSLSTRLNDKKRDAIICVMQRLHEKDISARCIELGYTHLCLPAEPERRQTIFLPMSKREIVRDEGELLWAEREGRAELDAAKKALGSYGYSGQYQQQPSPAGGGMFKRDWWRFYRRAPALTDFDEIIQSWDCAFKGLDSSDYVVGQIWGRKGADKYLLDQVRDRMTFTATLTAIRSLSAKWRTAFAKLVEEKANGAAVIDTLKHEIAGIIPINPEGGKEARAAAVAPQVEAGNVYLPDPIFDLETGYVPPDWIHDFIEEAAKFPKAAHDDQVDGMTQALLRLELHQADDEDDDIPESHGYYEVGY